MSTLTNKKAIVGLGILGVAGVAGAAFAASVDLDPSNAGQGVDVVEGFVVTNVEYDGGFGAGNDEENVTVAEVEFDIARSGTNAGVALEDDNASVFVQLRDGAVLSDWVECALGTGGTLATDEAIGHVVCDTTAAGDTINIADIDNLSVVAYDDLDA